MKKRALLWGSLILAAVIAAASVLAFLLRPQRQLSRDEVKAIPAVRTVMVYAALAENPAAERVLLIGSESAAYREYFERAGCECSDRAKGAFDIVFAAGKGVDLNSKAVRQTLHAGGVLALCINARSLPAPELWECLNSIPAEDFHFWMPGEFDWLAVAGDAARKVRLSEMMDLFVRENSFADLAAARCDSLPTLFAAYTGTKADVMPAFNGSVGDVRADNFTTRQTPSLAWIDSSLVDSDIARDALSQMRSAQIVRRMVLAGNMYAARGDEVKAAETWARAAESNPDDTLIVERLERLSVNGQVFLQLGKPAMAARCYETMAQIRPDDPMPVHNYAVCLQKLGKKDFALRAFARARELEKKQHEKESAK